ncbi:glycosyltransferase family 4 protein [Halomicronema sp. CCY15110]|uniref:glycosyltransferase family 4 protein n=1 Tax=Halomicronema sp. CCY15110 TaxID=2767773 RepID=UPI0019509144|nr:glycosyltransferase family 4 protein [Halomicronema sp. CCY15110]
MKVLHICSIGVTAKVLLSPQINYLQSRGLDVHIVCSSDEVAKALSQQGYTLHLINIDRKIAPLGNLMSLVKLFQLMQREQYDLVHVHTSIAAFLGRIAAKLAGVPRIVYTAHGYPFHDQLPRAKYWFYFGLEKCCASLTDLFLTQSYEDWVDSSRLRLCPARKVRHLNNGVDSQRFSRERLDPKQQQMLRQSFHIPLEAGPIIGTIGRLTREKGFAYLIEAFAQLAAQFPQARLLIVGSELKTDPDPFEAELLQRSLALGIRDRIVFTGFRDDIPELLGLLDVFTLPTYFGEGLPRSILEAMAMGLPIVTTDIRGCREAVQPDVNGYIVPPRDSSQLADALTKLLADPALRQQFGRASRDRVEREYDERLVFQRLEQAYRDLGLVVAKQPTAEWVLSGAAVIAAENSMGYGGH